jgi:hypothetical protein
MATEMKRTMEALNNTSRALQEMEQTPPIVDCELEKPLRPGASPPALEPVRKSLIGRASAPTRAFLPNFCVRQGAAVCQALNSIANMQKKPANKRMRAATSGNGKDY